MKYCSSEIIMKFVMVVHFLVIFQLISWNMPCGASFLHHYVIICQHSHVNYLYPNLYIPVGCFTIFFALFNLFMANML